MSKILGVSMINAYLAQDQIQISGAPCLLEALLPLSYHMVKDVARSYRRIRVVVEKILHAHLSVSRIKSFQFSPTAASRASSFATSTKVVPCSAAFPRDSVSWFDQIEMP
jgi:hypothetical protein